MRTLLVIVITAAVTWVTLSIVQGMRSSAQRMWLISAVKTPGRMALAEIQEDMNAGKYDLAKAKIDVLTATWQRFESGPDSFRGYGIGDIMVALGKVDAATNSTAQK